MKITRASNLQGRLIMPGDKSISHRAAMFAAISGGTTKIENFAASADCASTLGCLSALGVGVDREGSTVAVRGAGKTGFMPSKADLDCGNSGTTMRLMAGILAGQRFGSVLTGDESLQKRPMRRVIDPLTRMGASIASENGCAPIRIARSRLAGLEYRLPVASAQIKSCVLLAGLFATGETTVLEPTPTRDHTERMLRWFGCELIEDTGDAGKRITISGDQVLKANDFVVPGDVSSSAFFLVAAACLPGSSLVLENVGLNPSRTAVIDALKRFGANIEIQNERIACNEPVGDIAHRR